MLIFFLIVISFHSIHSSDNPLFLNKTPDQSDKLDDIDWNSFDLKYDWTNNQLNHYNERTVKRQNDGQNCDCGLENYSDRIVGGSEVNPKHRYPWIIAIRFGGRSIICGGSIIDPYYILTAAHCLVGLDANEIEILVGCHDVRHKDCKVYSVAKIIPHSGYSRSNHQDDIGLIKLSKPISYSSRVNPVCLPLPSTSVENELKNQPFIIAGWGHMEQGGFSSNVLQHTKVNYVNRSTCRSFYPSSLITGKNFCAAAGRSDACQGDSGGPAMKRDKFNRIELMGIISFGRGCGNTDSPGVYTDVVKYLDWIAFNSQFAGCFASDSDKNVEKSISERCGLTKSKTVRTRIAGGQTVTQTNYPWNAAIGYRGQLIGGGTLIQSNLILTTASLIRPIIESRDFNIRQLLIILGASDITQRENDRRSFQVSRVIIHPDHSLVNRYKNDYTILILSSSVESQFTPICLPTQETPYPVNYNVRSLGWGRITTSSIGSNSLRQVDLKLTDRSNCLRFYSNNLSDDLFCASGYNSGPCNGDEGGPLMIQFNQQYYLAGLYSHVHPYQPCGQQGVPSLFADTRHGLDWIHKIMYSNQ